MSGLKITVEFCQEADSVTFSDECFKDKESKERLIRCIEELYDSWVRKAERIKECRS